MIFLTVYGLFHPYRGDIMLYTCVDWSIITFILNNWDNVGRISEITVCKNSFSCLFDLANSRNHTVIMYHVLLLGN